jgi:MYXO-CTERM domain-containing protein
MKVHRDIARVLFALAAVVIVVSPRAAQAALIAYDGFDYAEGQLRTNGGWVGSNTSTPRPTVVAGSLSYPDLPPSVGNSVQLTNANGTADRLSTGTVTSGNKLYYSLIVKTGTGGNAGGAFFAGFDTAASGTTFTPAGALYTRIDPVDNTKQNIGIRAGAASDIAWSGPFTPGDTLFAVGGYTVGGGATLDLFNSPAAIPVSEPGTHTAATIGTDPAVTSVVAFYLRQNTGEPSTIQVDELRIGTTWADVAPVPEPASAGVVALGALAALARRRRRRHG